MGIKNLLPARSEIAPPDRTVVLDLSSEEADDIFGVLSSSTAREILQSLHREPQPASEIASNLDLTLQNVNYHVQKLRDADLIEIADVWYSDTGNEMKVYAPSKKAVMVLADKPTIRQLRDHISRLFSLVLLLGAAAVFWRYGIVERFLVAPEDDRVEDDPAEAAAVDDDDVAIDADDAPDDDDVADDAPEPESEEDELVAAREDEALVDPDIPLEAALEALPVLLDPGVVFVLGAAAALVAIFGLRRYRQYKGKEF